MIARIYSANVLKCTKCTIILGKCKCECKCKWVFFYLLNNEKIDLRIVLYCARTHVIHVCARWQQQLIMKCLPQCTSYANSTWISITTATRSCRVPAAAAVERLGAVCVKWSWVWVCVVSGCVSGRLAPANSVSANVHLTVTTERLVRLDSDTGSGLPLPQPGHIGTGQNVSQPPQSECLIRMLSVHANMCASWPRLPFIHLVMVTGVGWAHRSQELYLYICLVWHGVWWDSIWYVTS